MCPRFGLAAFACEHPPSAHSRARPSAAGPGRGPRAFGTGASDPYCTVGLKDGVGPVWRTATRKNNLRPVWDETFLVPIQDPSRQVVQFDVFDWNSLRPVRLLATMRAQAALLLLRLP